LSKVGARYRNSSSRAAAAAADCVLSLSAHCCSCHTGPAHRRRRQVSQQPMLISPPTCRLLLGSTCQPTCRLSALALHCELAHPFHVAAIPVFAANLFLDLMMDGKRTTRQARQLRTIGRCKLWGPRCMRVRQPITGRSVQRVAAAAPAAAVQPCSPPPRSSTLMEIALTFCASEPRTSALRPGRALSSRFAAPNTLALPQRRSPRQP